MSSTKEKSNSHRRKLSYIHDMDRLRLGKMVYETRCCNPSGVEINRNGAIILADSNNNRIRMITGGQVTTMSGDGDREPKIDRPRA